LESSLGRNQGVCRYGFIWFVSFIPSISFLMFSADLMKPYLDEIIIEVTVVLEKETDLDVLHDALEMVKQFLAEGIV
jgi:hypothetical protein